MRTSLVIEAEKIRYQAPPVKQTGTVRYAPSFEMRLADIRIIGYVPRIIADDESGFLVLVTAIEGINYFNLDTAASSAIAKLEDIFNFRIKDLPTIPFEEVNWHSFIAYPQALAGQPLFKTWNWLSPRGFLKNLGKVLSLDNPIWERLTDEAKTYLRQ